MYVGEFTKVLCFTSKKKGTKWLSWSSRFLFAIFVDRYSLLAEMLSFEFNKSDAKTKNKNKFSVFTPGMCIIINYMCVQNNVQLIDYTV